MNQHGPSIRSLLGSFVATAVVVTSVIGFAVLASEDGRAGAFGSVDSSILNQKPVHEKITRTLGCTAQDPIVECFDPVSLSLLAGTDGTFGGVAEPDNPLDGFPNPAARHCDDADYGYGSGHTEAEAWTELRNCLDYFQQYLDLAVEQAGLLINTDGTVRADQIEITNAFGTTFNACKFSDPLKGGGLPSDGAKCSVINYLGRALHIAEDFWSHSNWGDLADPAKDVGLENPVGLSQTTQPEFFAYPSEVPATFTADLISGCDDSLGASRCEGRTAHSMLNKDNGDVDPATCAATGPLTTRGQVIVDGTSNFSRAVTGACAMARAVWADLSAAIVAGYGPERAATIIRTITSDGPLTACSLSGSAARAYKVPVAATDSARSVDITLDNRSGAALSCASASLDGGEWTAYPPDALDVDATAQWRTQSNGLATGTEGGATLRIGDGDATVTLHWNDPYVGSNKYSCEASAGYSCAVTGGKGNQAAVTYSLTKQ